MTIATRQGAADTMIADRIKVIDVDTHIPEPGNIWTDRVSEKKWGDQIPHVGVDEDGVKTWIIGGKPASRAQDLDALDASQYDSSARLKYMDKVGIYAAVVYPNLAGFGNQRFLDLKEPELMLECVQAYNDFMSDWASVDHNRLLPVMATPFWDIDAAAKEIYRAKKIGLRAVLMPGSPDKWGYPPISDHAWEPVWSAAEEVGMPINFHVANSGLEGFGITTPNREDLTDSPDFKLPQKKIGGGMFKNRTEYAANTVGGFLNLAKHHIEVVFSGIAHRHPKLNFVDVESGIGWLPFVLEISDWHWKALEADRENPDMEKPSFYYKRQCYNCFWFEKASAKAAIEAMGPDNFLYETDYPHPTSMTAGNVTGAVEPRAFIEEFFGTLPEEDTRKLLHENAARLYDVKG